MNTLAAVLAIFQDHVPARTVGPDDDLFALGVDSLTAVRLGLDLERRFGVVIPPRGSRPRRKNALNPNERRSADP